MLVWSASVVGPRLAAAPRGAATPAGLLRFATLQGLSGLFTLAALRGGVITVALLGASKTQTSFAALAFSLVAAAVFTVFQVFTVQLPGLVATESPAGAEASARRLAAQILPVAMFLAVLAALMAGPAVPLVFGDSFAGARDAVAIAFAILPLAPLTALATQTATLRLRPGARALAAGAGTTVLAAVAAVAVPAHGAVGASLALVAASAATLLVAARLLPGVFGSRLLAAGLAGATLVLAIGVLGG
jgi:O-antigen/teichoic acid export membrane protein